MDRETVVSEAITSVGYQDGTLEIEFATATSTATSTCRGSSSCEFMRAESKGSFFNERIRDSYRVEGPL